MFGLGTSELVIILVIVLLLVGKDRFSGWWDNLKNGGGPFDGGDGFELQPITSQGSQLSRCHKCGAQTKDSYENCPVCGEKTGGGNSLSKEGYQWT